MKRVLLLFVLCLTYTGLVFGQARPGSQSTIVAPAESTSAPADTSADMNKANDTIADSQQVINEIMKISARSIPTSMLAKAQGLVIVPSMVKGGFVAGGAYGRGVFLTRQPGQPWNPPTFISMANGSVGFQVGVQSTDVILVFCTKRSVDAFTSGKFTLGVDAAVAAGPVGRQASAGTDLTLTAEVYSYSRSRGLFLGAAIDGGVLNIDTQTTNQYYGTPGTPIPAPAATLLQTINNYSGLSNNQTESAIAPPVTGAVAAPNQAAETLKPQLADAYKALLPMLDPQWQSYLALPAEVYTPAGSPLPAAQAMQEAYNHYQAVSSNEQYKALFTKTEFQKVAQLLDQYIRTVK